MPRRAAAAAALATWLIGGCTHRAPAAAPPAAAAAPASTAGGAAELSPEAAMEAVHAANPHAHDGKPLCQRCHLPGEKGVAVDPIALCAQCHDPAHMKHPYDVQQPNAPASLPFDTGGRIVCHTCHDPHDVKKHKGGLRLEYSELCTQCHVRHGKKSSPAAPH